MVKVQKARTVNNGENETVLTVCLFRFLPGDHSGAQQSLPAGCRERERGGRKLHRPVETRHTSQGMSTPPPPPPTGSLSIAEHTFMTACHTERIQENWHKRENFNICSQCLFSGVSVCSEPSLRFTAVYLPYQRVWAPNKSCSVMCNGVVYEHRSGA